MSVDLDMIKKAYDITITNTQKLSYPYMTKILQSLCDGTFDAPKTYGKSIVNYSERTQLDKNEMDLIQKRREYIKRGES